MTELISVLTLFSLVWLFAAAWDQRYSILFWWFVVMTSSLFIAAIAMHVLWPLI